MSLPGLNYFPFGTNPEGIERSITSTARSKAILQNNITSLRSALSSVPDDVLDAVGDDNPRKLPGPLNALTAYTLSQVREHRRERPQYLNMLSGYERQYKAVIDDLVKLNTRLAQAKKTSLVTLTSEELNAIVANVGGVIAYGDGESCVCLEFTGIKMSPDVNIYKNLNDGGHIAIELNSITAVVNMNGGTVTITGERLVEGGFGPRAHPHVLGGDKPCLGGFEGTLVDAVMQNDIEVVAIVLKMYLSQANAYDTAGKHWMRWLPKDLKQQKPDKTDYYISGFGTLIKYNDIYYENNDSWHIGERKVGVKKNMRHVQGYTVDKHQLTNMVIDALGRCDKESVHDFVGDLPITILGEDEELL